MVLPYLDKVAEHDGFALYKGHDTVVLQLSTLDVWQYQGDKCLEGIPDILRFCEKFAGLPSTIKPSRSETVYIVWSKLLSLCDRKLMQAVDEEFIVWKQVVTTWRWILEIYSQTPKERLKGKRIRKVMDWYYSLSRWQRVNLPSSSPSSSSSPST